MDPGPFAHFDPAGLTPEHRRVVEISREQFRRHGHSDARVVWKGSALCAAVTYGQRGWLPVTLALTEDGMCYCGTASTGGVLWCISVLPPNRCRVKRGAFWISRIDGSESAAKFGRLHPFMAHFAHPRNVTVPYLGVVAIVQGRRRGRRFGDVLRSLGAQCD